MKLDIRNDDERVLALHRWGYAHSKGMPDPDGYVQEAVLAFRAAHPEGLPWSAPAAVRRPSLAERLEGAHIAAARIEERNRAHRIAMNTPRGAYQGDLAHRIAEAILKGET